MYYEPMRGGRLLIMAVFGVLALAGILLLVSVLSGRKNAPPVAFAVLWLFALGWNAYWWLTRIATHITIDGNVVRWSAPVRKGRIALSDIVEVRPMRFVSNVEVLVCRGQRPILVMATKGLRSFTDDLVRHRPDLPVRLGWQAKLAERMPGRSRLR